MRPSAPRAEGGDSPAGRSDRRGEESFERWIGRERTAEDTLTLERARKLAATLDLDPAALGAGDPLPPGWHWIYCRDAPTGSALADDGHARRGDFLPPIPLERRMWAGGRVRFLSPLRLGEPVRRVSTVRSIERKKGRSGPLAFVTVRHRLHDAGGVAVEEEQDLVYLNRAGPRAESAGREPSASTRPPAAPADWTEPFSADEVMLFRFSALTFNAHRIHYDRPYAVDVEGYSGIVVHGPLLALLLLGAGRHWLDAEAPPVHGLRFDYRAVQPIFCNEAIDLCGARSEGAAVDLWVNHPERGVAMTADVTMEEPA